MLLASFDNVTKEFGTQTVLTGALLKISSGRRVGLIGPNGWGKTTLLRVLLGLDPPSSLLKQRRTRAMWNHSFAAWPGT